VESYAKADQRGQKVIENQEIPARSALHPSLEPDHRGQRELRGKVQGKLGRGSFGRPHLRVIR